MTDAAAGSDTDWKASYFAALKERDDARDEIESLQSQVREQQEHIDALQAKVHLSAGYDKLQSQVQSLEQERERLREEINRIGALASQGVSAAIIRQQVAYVLRTTPTDSAESINKRPTDRY